MKSDDAVYLWDEFNGMGNRLKRGLNPMMLTEQGLTVSKRQKLTRGEYAEYRNISIVYDRRFVITKLIKEVIEPLGVKESVMLEILAQAYKEIRSKQTVLFSGSEKQDD